MKKDTSPFFNPWHPKYGLAWIVVGLLFLLSLIPYRIQLLLGSALGRVCYVLLVNEKRIAKINLALSFPDESEDARQKLLVQHFISLGISFFEITLARFATPKRLARLVDQILGTEYVKQAMTQDVGIILLAPHFTCIQLCARLMSLYCPVSIVYRPHKLPFINYFFEGIYRKCDGMIPRRRVRQLVHALKKEKRIVCYTPDVDTGRKNSVFVPFFNISTATSITPAVIARLTQAIAIPVFCVRQPNKKGYALTVEKPFVPFPTNNMENDMTRINEFVEAVVTQYPDQYLWTYKRFKSRPPGEKRFYTHHQQPP